MTSPAAGPARRFAGSETNGMPPNTVTSTGATATCAARVTAAASASASGPGRRRRSRPARATIPAVAATERTNPTAWTSSGIDQDQGGHGQGQDPGAGHLPPAEGRSCRHRRHRRGPQHRGLEPREQGEEAEHPQDGGEPCRKAEAAQGEPGHDEHERDVLARHGQQVAQARGPEVVGRGRRLAPVVAEQDPREQRRGLVAQRRRAPDHRPAQRVGQTADGVADLHGSDPVGQEPTGHMADRQVGPPGHGDHPPGDGHPLPRQRLGEGGRRRLVGGFDLEASPVEPDDGGEGPVVHLRVRHEHDGAVGDGRGGRRFQARPRPVPEARRQQEPTEAQQRRPPAVQGDHGHDDPHRRRHRRRPPRPEARPPGPGPRRPGRSPLLPLRPTAHRLAGRSGPPIGHPR